jgi:hypothetical protein
VNRQTIGKRYLMPCLFRALGALCIFIGGGMAGLLSHAAEPDIVALACSQTVLMGYRPAVQYAWQTQYAATVRAESGYLDAQSVFHPGGWHVVDNLPPQGDSIFLMKINNYAVRVCITAPESTTDPVCAVCVPHPVSGSD